ncbi:sporulation integral membrane protein YlbJ [Paenibacillus sp. 1_12]|uniref:sporulation integral membrane protein YlbJ n=1 Tax=Paenibacillus sp. 1_12 TaxID=1566278 RepID=UPI0008EC7D5B|nr:sporulation integral membrane protein YlbJ [Paenibacillus sp. 1_12]SFK80000.1 sporulation integral membrane protein YlbJ [Paenibacillus sp. 1_12]
MKVNNFAFTYGIGLLAVGLLVSMLFFPAQALHASLKGLAIWWDVLFPALFPFLVISELMLGLGIVHFFGMLLDPVMRPVFRIPGTGGFVMAMGFAAGYPVAAKLTSQLWEQRLINREEGERLVAFTTTSDPIFLIGAVSVGFFHDVSLAGILAAAHYGTAILVGFMMRFHGGAAGTATPSTTQASSNKSARSLLSRAFRAMHRARLLDGRSLGEMLRQAIQTSLQLVMVIGGLVVFFAVVIEIMSSTQVMPIVYNGIEAVLQLFGLPKELSEAIAGGIFEVTLGAKAAGSAPAPISLMHKAAIAAFILSWAGLSVHAQIISILHHTNLRYFPFVVARLVHALLAASAVLLLWEPMQSYRGATALTLPVMNFTAQLPDKPNYVLPWMMTACIGLLFGLFMFYALPLAVKQWLKWLK